MSYKSEIQNKNIAWFLPRPKPDRYKGGMPLHCEKWLLELAGDLLGRRDFRLLNLFCGMNTEGFRVDIKPEVNPDLVADAHNFVNLLPDGFSEFDVILADPPYSNKESEELYGTSPLRYKDWTNECDKVLSPNGILIVYHKQVMPNPNPEKYYVEKRVFVGNRVYHVPRIAIYFRKKELGYNSVNKKNLIYTQPI